MNNKISKFEAYENDGGALFLAIFDNDGEVHFFSDYEYSVGVMSEVISDILNGSLTEKDVRNFDNDHPEWYEETANTCMIIADETGAKNVDSWGFAAYKELSALYKIEQE